MLKQKWIKKEESQHERERERAREREREGEREREREIEKFQKTSQKIKLLEVNEKIDCRGNGYFK